MTKRPEDQPTVETDERTATPDHEPGADDVQSDNGFASPSQAAPETVKRPSPVPRSEAEASAAEPNGDRPDGVQSEVSEPDGLPDSTGSDKAEPAAEWKPAVGNLAPAAAVSAGTLPPWQRTTYGPVDAETETIADAPVAPSDPAAASDPSNGLEPDPPSSPLPGLAATQTVTDAPPDGSGDPATAPPEAPAQPTAPVPPVPPVGGSSATTGSWPTTRGRARPPRQASLQLKRVDPWSVLKLALVLAVVTFFVWLVAVGVLYGVLDGMGVWDRLNGTYSDLVSPEEAGGGVLINAGRVFGAAAIIGAINSVLLAVAVTVGAFVYNVAADLVGGIELTLSERD